jgi:hypothetical protein
MAKRFISRTKENDMVTVDLGYRKIVLPNDKALELAALLQGAEMYEEVYIHSDKRVSKDDDHTYHVYPVKELFALRLLSDSLYQMAKLAGKPEKS